MILIYPVLDWLYQNTAGNLVASFLAFGIGYVWKIRPHLKKIHNTHIEILGRIDESNSDRTLGGDPASRVPGLAGPTPGSGDLTL